MVPIRVIKIGGSLLRRDNLLTDLRNWQQIQVDPRVNVWITGGGAAVDAIRNRYQTGGLEDTDAHWSSIEAMDANSVSLASKLAEWKLTSDPEDLLQAASLLTSNEKFVVGNCRWPGRKIASHAKQKAITPTQNFIFQTKDWLIAAERKRESHSRLPHSWDVTSDSIAAWVSIQLHATELILLKSCDVPDVVIAELAELGIVDTHFPTLYPQLQTLSFTCQQLPCFNS